MDDNHPAISAPSLASLTWALLLAGVGFGFVTAVAYCSFVLFALLEGLRVPFTVGLGVVVGVVIERGAIATVTGWRPAVGCVLLSGVPGGVVAFAVDRLLGHGLSAIVGGAVAGLCAQAISLRRLTSVAAQERR